MNLLDIILIAIGLAMDCFAVSIACGLTLKKVVFKPFFTISFFFGLFQAIMPLIGWYIGSSFKSLIEDYDHWVAFIILIILGIRMIYEYFRNLHNPEESKSFDPNKLAVVITLAIATSIDALAVGFSFAFLDFELWIPIIIIGITSSVFSIIGLLIGSKYSHLVKIPAEFIGGIVLIAIGAKILIEHLFFS